MGWRAESSAIEAKWRAQLENELQIARMFGILNRIPEDNSDEFSYNNLSIFERNKKIHRQLNLREWNENWKQSKMTKLGKDGAKDERL